MVAFRALLALIVALAFAPYAEAAPEILGTEVVGVPATGEPFMITVQAVDPQRAISSLNVREAGRDVPQAGVSACGLRRDGSRDEDGSFAPGTPVRLAVPFALAEPGVRLIAVTVGSGGCEDEPETTTTQLSVAVTLPPLPLPDLPSLPVVPRVGASASAEACPDPDLRPNRTNRRAVRRAIKCLLNRERAAQGQRALKSNRKLRRIARAHSRDMVKRNYFSHVSPTGSTLLSRLKRARYWPAAAGENLAWGDRPLSTPRSFVQAWMASDGHRQNILDAGWRQIGIGVATRRGRSYATTNFGRR